ncbi:MAG: orotidine 5'-phosphate decarboxylase / HUMPS family protein [Spirochaetota bacterium]
MSQNYIEILRQSYRRVGNNICLGVDPQWQKLPAPYRRKLPRKFSSGNEAPLVDCGALQDFLEQSLESLKSQQLSPAAFKPNAGYFQALDRPLLGLDSRHVKHSRHSRHLKHEEAGYSGNSPDMALKYAFGGSRLLAWLHCYLSEHFPGIPIILDFKKGDIARSSANYAEEGFALWGSDALTVSPYMGFDSLAPFGMDLRPHLESKGYPQDIVSQSCHLPCGSGGVYSLLRTSNPGGKDVQNLLLKEDGELPLYLALAGSLLRWRDELRIPGLGAVVGATSLRELDRLAGLFSRHEFPLLIPGVGGQGGSFREVLSSLNRAAYPLELSRINLSSGLLQSWEGEAPDDWPRRITEKFNALSDPSWGL